MNTFSHVLLGKYILDHVKIQHGIVLHKKSFLIGSLLPDFKLSFMARPHAPEYWETYLKKQIESLTETKTPDTSFSRGYSLKLGVICHFYTDFFCYPHNSVYDGTSREHMKYEWELHRFLKENEVPDPIKEIDDDYDSEDNAFLIYNVFERVHGEYAEHIGPSYRKDIRFALRACIGAVTQIALNSAEETAEMAPVPSTPVG